MTTLASTVETYVSCTSHLQYNHPNNHLSVSQPRLSHRRSTSRLLAIKTELSDLALQVPSPVHALATLRLHTLTYLSDLETRLSSIEPALIAECLKAKGDAEVEKTRRWARTGLDMLARIRADVASHLPDMPQLLTPRTPRTPRTPTVPETEQSLLSPLKAPDEGLEVDYVPKLSEHLYSLQSHLASCELPHVFAEAFATMKPHATVQELIHLSLAPMFVDPTVEHGKQGEHNVEGAEAEISRALEVSCNGTRLLEFSELPKAWQFNPFVTQGYRFIPLARWPRILQSLFEVHSETANIHTHSIPLIIWTLTLLPFSPFATSTTARADVAEWIFNGFTVLAMFNSVVWHTMSGCADPHAVDLCAKVDYVGIGWLTCAFVGTIIYYGFQNYLAAQVFWLVFCVMLMVPCTVVPFTAWFDGEESRPWRIKFFLGIGGSSFAPIVHLFYVYGLGNTLAFMKPVCIPTATFFVGVAAYASHFPEAFVRRHGQKHWLDWVGGGSHALWHIFVIIGITLWRGALQNFKAGIPS